jgi:hypothetical protein
MRHDWLERKWEHGRHPLLKIDKAIEMNGMMLGYQ